MQNALTKLWTDRVSDWARSGRSQRAFCADKSFTHHSLTLWSSRLRRIGVAPPKKIRLAPVIRAAARNEDAGVVASKSAVSIAVGNICVQVAGDQEPRWIANLILALGEKR